MKEKISVIGAGIMGTGISQVAATHGVEVNLIDINSDILEKSKSNLSSIMERLIYKKKISIDESSSLLSKIQWTTDMNVISDSHLVIEAVIENIDLKQKIFSTIGLIYDIDLLCT